MTTNTIEDKNKHKCRRCSCILYGLVEESLSNGTKIKRLPLSKISDIDSTLCTSCVNYKDKIKNKCYFCDRYIHNTEEHYKKMGNCCIKCNILFGY